MRTKCLDTLSSRTVLLLATKDRPDIPGGDEGIEGGWAAVSEKKAAARIPTCIVEASRLRRSIHPLHCSKFFSLGMPVDVVNKFVHVCFSKSLFD